MVDLEIITDVGGWYCEQKLGHVLLVDIDRHHSCFCF